MGGVPAAAPDPRRGRKNAPQRSPADTLISAPICLELDEWGVLYFSARNFARRRGQISLPGEPPVVCDAAPPLSRMEMAGRLSGISEADPAEG